MEESIKKKVIEMHLEENVIFTGIRSDIPQILSAMDVFILPSFFEGMPNVVLEAQAVGVPCLISDNITKEVDITGLVTFLSIDDNVELWALRAQEVAIAGKRDTHEFFVSQKYDIKSSSEIFLKTVFDEGV